MNLKQLEILGDSKHFSYNLLEDIKKNLFGFSNRDFYLYKEIYSLPEDINKKVSLIKMKGLNQTLKNILSKTKMEYFFSNTNNDIVNIRIKLDEKNILNEYIFKIITVNGNKAFESLYSLNDNYISEKELEIYYSDYFKEKKKHYSIIENYIINKEKNEKSLVKTREEEILSFKHE